MKILRRLQLGEMYQSKEVIFFQPDTQEELDGLFRFRFQIYSQRGYIDSKKFPDGLEKDEYDVSGKCQYFCAKLSDGKLIGSIRLILSGVLPTELDYAFEEPAKMGKLPRAQRGELGRLAIIPPDREKKVFLPRNLILLFLLDLLVDYGLKHNINGGYAFVKTSLKKKLGKIKAPFHYIRDFRPTYTKDNVLYSYFTSKSDPVVPGYFITKDFGDYTAKIIRISRIFRIKDFVHYELRANLYTRFLKFLKVI